MNIEFNLILTIISVAAAVYFAFKSDSRDNDDDVSRRAQEGAILSQKLDSIREDTQEMRKEIVDVRGKVNALSERLILVEHDTKSAHERINHFEGEEAQKKSRKRWL